MSVQEITLTEINYYLTLTNWQILSEGPAGQIWTKTDSEGKPHLISVPRKPAPDLIRWRDVVDRISKFELKTFENAQFRIKYPNMDIAKIRGASDILINGTIPLKSGVGLVGSTYKMLRASATTSRRARGHIAGGFSKTGDEIVAQARLGQTEIGSYIIPILMPLSESSQVGIDSTTQQDTLENQHVPFEPIERRVTRTFAQSLQALSVNIVEPAHDPRRSQMGNLITAGVSREFVVAISEILEGGSVSTFDASFDWAPSIDKPTGVPEQVSIPIQAQELLVKTAKLLKNSREDSNQSFSGRIVDVHWDADDPFGVIGLQTFRNSRATVVNVTLNEEQIHKALVWMNARRAVIVNGKADQDPGKRARILSPRKFNALDEDFLQ